MDINLVLQWICLAICVGILAYEMISEIKRKK